MPKIMLMSDTHYGLDGSTDAKHRKFWKRVKKAIDEQKVDVLIWAGDIACNRQRHIDRSFEYARAHVPAHVPILVVFGNHDWWDDADPDDRDAGRRSFETIKRLHDARCRLRNIHWLSEWGTFTFGDVLFCGWDGWYGKPPQTNDAAHMFRDVEGVPMHAFMANRAYTQFQNCLDVDTAGYRKVVGVTHHNTYCQDGDYAQYCANLKYHELAKDKFDVLCCGHNHQFRNDVEDGTLIVNSGSDYNKPAFLTFEV